MTIETKKVSVAEAIAIIERLNYRNNSFVYDQTTREHDADIQYRHFDGYKENGEKDGFALIEIVVDGKLAAVRFFNHFRSITVDLLLGDFNPDYSDDQVIDANDAEIKLANTTKKTKKHYSINPVIDCDDQIKFNHLNIFLTADGALQIDGFFQCKRITTAYNCFKKIMAQAAIDVPQLNGWGNCWLDAKSISELDGYFFNENGDLLFNNSDPRDTLAVDINEDQFYFFANFSAASKPLEAFDYGAADREQIMCTPLVSTDALDAATNAEIELANTYKPQTQWENPHDFTVTGDLSDRNINGRIIAAYIDREQQLELADMKADGVQYLLKVITPQPHSFRKFDFCICTNSYNSFDALKKFGRNKIHDCNWRIETIDGKLLAKGAGIADFDTFCNEKNVNQHDDFHSKLAELQANVADAKAVRDVKQAAFNQAQKEFDEANDAVFNAQYAIIQLGDAKAKELQNSLLDGSEHIEIHFSPINRKFVIYEIHGMDVPKELATCATPELVIDAVNQIKHVDNFSLDDFEEHLLALQKEQEDAYPDEVKEINRELAQSNLEAPHMLLKIYNKDFHTGSFCGVKLNKLHVKSFVTDKIHFNICYAAEPLECYDTFEEVTDAINHFKDAIMHGATKFKFPTSDELNPPTTSASKMTVEELQKAFWSGHLPPAFETTIRAALKKATDDKRARLKKSGRTRCRLVVPQVNAILAKLLESGELNQAEQPQEPTRKQINDSLIRAMETNLKNIQAHCLNLDFNAAVDELNLYHICNNALLRKEVA